MQITRLINYALITLFALGIAACGGGSSNADGNDEDSTAPTISSTSPADNANDVPQNSTITATFNEDILSTSVGATSFTLLKSIGENTVGSVSFDGANNVASFTPDSPLAKLTTYTATLSADIADLSGNAFASNYNWSFTTADGAWGNAELIEDETNDAENPQIAIDNNGNAFAVWQQKDSNERFNIWINYFNGSSWESPELIETNDSGVASNPQIAIDNNGNAIVVWSQRNSVHYNIWANRFNGNNWVGAEAIEINDEDSQNPLSASNPQIAFDNNGNALAVWQQSDSNSRINIWVNLFNGSSWGSPERIDDNDIGNGNNPQIAFDSNGNAFAVWEQFDGALVNIMINRFNGTTWTGTETIETNDSGHTHTPQIAFDNNGNALAVWQQDDGINFISNIWANHFNGSNWGTAIPMGNTDTGTARKPQIAFDGNGKALAVWSQFDNTRNSIWVNRFDGVNWGTAELIETNDVSHAENAQIAIDSSGNALAVWQQFDDNRLSIWSNRFNGSNWGTAEIIETNDVSNAENAQIAIDNNGNALAVWEQSEGDVFSIWSNRFE